MHYALLPFPTVSNSTETEGKPDIRSALSARERVVHGDAIDNLDLLNVVVEALRDLPWDFAVDLCREQDGHLHLAVIARDLGRNVDVGDTMHAGFFLQNSEISKSRLLACSRVFRVVCRNGALIECDQGQSFDLCSGDSSRNNWRRKVTDVVKRSFCGEGLDVDLARFRATTEKMLITPYEWLCHLSAQGLIDEDEQSEILVAFNEAADFTMYGLINAVTSVAHGLRANDRWTRSFRLERLGGEILRGDHQLPSFEPAFAR